MGEVYLAEDARLRRRVALKVLPPGDGRGRGQPAPEGSPSCRTLDHPNICTVYEVGEADGRGFIAMRYVEGTNLSDRFKQAPLELQAAISIGAQVANAVAEAHRHGIVHCDIKPQNVIVSAGNQATLLDFGLAKSSGPDSQVPPLRRST